MIRFGKRVKHKKLLLFVTALDQTVIARPNLRVDLESWEKLPVFDRPELLVERALVETPVYDHIRTVLESGKYRFLWNDQLEFDRILENLMSLELPEILWQEISRLQQFGYYYHHALAILLGITRFGMDTNANEETIRLAQKVSLLSDIGISRLPNTILFSSHLFTEDERITMQQHPLISYLLLGYYLQKSNRDLGLSVYFHHWPDEEAATDIPFVGRYRDAAWLVYNFDIFDALISNRPFRPAYRPENAIIYLKQINRTFSLPLDVVYWLEKKFKMFYPMNGPSFIPVHPSVQEHQLN